MFATLKLLNAYFWKTIYGPILAFIFPLILLGILGNVLRLEYIYPGLIALSMLFLGLIALPLAIMELKGSSLFKYIGSSPVNPVKFTSVVIGFYAFIAICTGFVIFLGTMAFFPSQAFPHAGFHHGVLGGIFTLKGFFSFYIGCGIHLAFVIMTGLVISTFSRTPQQALTLGLIITLPSMFLSGMVLSVDVIGESPAMNWISRFIPFRYSTANIVVAATPIDQLDSAISYWVHQPFNLKQSIDQTIGVAPADYPNNILDQMIWPYRNMTEPSIKASIRLTYNGHTLNGILIHDIYSVGKYLDTLPNQGRGYSDWVASGLPQSIFVGNAAIKASTDPTLFNLLAQKWSAMQLASDNNIFNFANNWGVRKIPSVDALSDFVNKYFRGVDANGNPLPDDQGGGNITDRVIKIAEQIKNGDFRWLNVFTHQSNILYYQVDKVLNIFLPLTLTGFGAWYTFKRFNWSAH